MKINFEARLLSDTSGGLKLPSNNTLDFDAKIPFPSIGVVKHLCIG